MKTILKKMLSKYSKFTAKKPCRFYEIDGFILDMGEEHALPLTQRQHLMYDRFVPFLGELVRAYSVEARWIIDIGANVGDTAAGMVKHSEKNILCVEPTQQFFQLCKKNIESFGEKYSSRIRLINAYIAKDVSENYQSRVVKGTAIKIKADTKAEAPTYTVIDLVNRECIAMDDIALIKVDTDGYDSECIMSIGEKLQEISPFLYWENQIDTKEQFKKYLCMLEYLEKSGYRHFFVFDNFGNFLCKVDILGLKNINQYLYRILNKKSTLTFYYVDVLACKDEQENVCQSVIGEYVSMYE
jgi:FkbM family methyltransferase